MSYQENPNLWGNMTVRMTGVNAYGDHPIVFTGTQARLEMSVTESERPLFSMTQGSVSYYKESVTVLPIPGRTQSVLAMLPAAAVNNPPIAVKCQVEIPLESRGGRPYVECFLNGIRIGSFRTGAGMVVFRANVPDLKIWSTAQEDKAWVAFVQAFTLGEGINITVGGFEDFGTWTEPRQLSRGTITVEAWLEA